MNKKIPAWTVLVSLLLGQCAITQTLPPATKHPADRASNAKTTPDALEGEIQKYEILLNDVDVKSDPDIRQALYEKWAEATCQSKKIKLQQILGGSDIKTANSMYTACLTRLRAQESSTAAGSNSQTSPAKVAAGAVTTPPDIPVPSGCNPVPSLIRNFDINHRASYQQPTTQRWSPPDHWVQLNANSSGAEISTKSAVWVGYINRLRYSATLGGVVTAIPTPTIPSNIFPAAPQATPSPAKAAPPTPPNFVQFGICLDDIASSISTFQGRLNQEELVLNDTRQRIASRVDTLQPVVNTIDEARAAADAAILPQNEIPAFPVGDVLQMRSLLTNFIAKYAEYADWAKTDSNNWSDFQRVSTGAVNLAAILDSYLTSPGQNPPKQNPPAPVTRQPSLAPNPTPSGVAASHTAATPPVAASSRTTTSPASSGSATPTPTPRPSPASSPSSTVSADKGTSSKADTPGPITVGSQEVQDYQANREYINEWIDLFQKVASAPPGFFVVNFKPVCGGWFGQGTSTQMQLTILDNLHPDPNPSARNLDKVVCQPVLTVTSGLGLSFIADKTPAFVAGIKKDAQGNPVLDSSGNPTIIQTLGFSHAASVRPAYAMEVNGSLWSSRESGFEIHGGVGAMLTAATGGATTDIIAGPSFSFKKRAFFVSPVYDLGLRTIYQSGFVVGAPQGNLTSPPTQQAWQSGWGVIISFPFPGTNTTNSATSSGKDAAKPAATAPTDQTITGSGGTNKRNQPGSASK